MENVRVLSRRRSYLSLLLAALCLLCILLVSSQLSADSTPQPDQVAPVSKPGHSGLLETGISIAIMDAPRIQQLGHTWAKTYTPPTNWEPVNILYRFDINNFYDQYSTGYRLQEIARVNGLYIDAYEIGNEPNIASEWNAPPNAVTYANHLCHAYRVIKQNDPTALVISAGLAPVGRVDGIFDGKLGHNGTIQDEREWIEEFIIAGGHNCADAIGFHPMGFRADFDADPDVATGDADTDCADGLCFRTIEKFRERMLARGIDMPIWATEVGWIVQPPANCLADSSWQGREWQIVSAEKRDANIQGAITYAAENYPWMDALFVWNLNFNEASWYRECEQMRFYSQDVGVNLPFKKFFLPFVTDR